MKQLLDQWKHSFKMRYLAGYRENYTLQQGLLIWKKIDSQLPLPKYCIKMDKARLQKFKELFADLSPEQQDQLKAWMEKQYHEATTNYAEHTTATIEEIERKVTYNYGSLLEALEKKEGY